MAVSETEWAPNIEHQIIQECTTIINNTYNDPETCIIIVKVGNILAGYAIIETNKKHGFGVITDILVLKEKRESGIGTQILEWIDNFFKVKAVTRIYLESGALNKVAHDFFKHHQYKHVSSVFMKVLHPVPGNALDPMQEKDRPQPINNDLYSCPICDVLLKHEDDNKSGIIGKKFWCPKCLREWDFCPICDSPTYCIKKGKCIRGLYDNCEHVIKR